MSRVVVLASRPAGTLRASDLELREEQLPACSDGELRLAITYLSIDPFTRIFLDEHALGGTLPGVPIGGVLPGAAIGRVEESRAPGYAKGDFVEGRFGWREECISGTTGIRKIAPEMEATSDMLGILGLPGMTAYTGIIGNLQIAEGETVIISSAAGSVGLIAGQIARRRGARAVGIAGGPAKCALVRDYGFDACVDYKAPYLEEALIGACPGGAHAYLDSVGGRVAMAAYGALARGGRVALCGLLSLYQEEGGLAGDLGRFMRLIMSRGLTIQAYSAVQSCPPGALRDLTAWMHEGVIRLPQTTIDGLEQAPAAFVDMLEGRIHGKLVIRTQAVTPS